MRVLHILDHSIPLQSGYTFRTLSILREQRRRGWETFHLTGPKQGKDDPGEETIEGWHFFRTPASSPTLGANLPAVREIHLMRRLEQRLQSVAERVRPHVLHAHSPVLNAMPALWVGKRLGIPVVYEVRSFWEDAAVDHGTTTQGSLRYRLSRNLETHALRAVSHVFTICEGLRSDILARGIPEGKVTVIPNAVDLDSFGSGGHADPALLASLGLSGCSIIGFIGSFYAYEGLALLIDALPGILGKLPNARLLLVGGGPQESALKDRVRRLGLDGKVVFAGRVPHQDVRLYYDLIDILVYPRLPMRLTDLVTPLKPLEAMAQGRLLIASDVGGHRELIRHGETGLLFRAGDIASLQDTLLQLFARRELWADLREAGRRYVQRERNWAIGVERYGPIYERLAPAS
jgi:PEP-CTERM/exosortase A-associated glycosyltransferase